MRGPNETRYGNLVGVVPDRGVELTGLPFPDRHGERPRQLRGREESFDDLGNLDGSGKKDQGIELNTKSREELDVLTPIDGFKNAGGGNGEAFKLRKAIVKKMEAGDMLEAVGIS